ncbi:MAG TPA: YeeE/YedE family protein [Pusillimonas sp.]|uniref:YeeE/YedE family protein n=1 Tax=unclassified Pusillimonas TaxID=2640016 RepID=UPI0026074773|nr:MULTISPECIES: YeeE/YedE family protein [unclassified Pusillimonas]HLU18583.1 YeeE/YedE family protein [Pusillimonas sp.]
MTHIQLVLWAGLAIGLAFGVCGQISGFCLHRGLTEIWSGKHGYKLHGFAVALAVALAGTQLLAGAGVINLSESLYYMPSYSWLLVPLGGLMFGYGMSLANGCGARALVLLGQGNLRSLLVLLCLGIAAYMTLTGLVAPLRLWLAEHTTFSPQSVAVPAGIPRNIVTWLVVALLLWFASRTRNSGHRSTDLLSGVVMGLLVVSGWVATGWLGADDFDPVPVTSLTFVAPIGDTIQYAMIATGMSLRFGITVVLGVVAGSFITSLLRRTCCLEGFDTARQMPRYVMGGLLMGSGGALAFGCSIGQGLTGLSTLAYGSMIAAAAIVIGARLNFVRSRA